jgi:hypothetical protein
VLRKDEALVGEVATMRKRFNEARPGDHLLCPFQCDLCHFRNVHGCDPKEGSEGHARFQADVRRAILDSFWARTTSTVASNLHEMRQYLRMAGLYELDVSLPLRVPRGPVPLDDSWGVLAACAMLRRSLDQGRNSRTIQFSTVRRLRTAVSNYTAMAQGRWGPTTIAGDKYKQRFTEAPTTSLFFEHFVQGCHARMGDVVVRDQALTIDVLAGLLELLEGEFYGPARTDVSKFEVTLLGAALTLGFSTALRGEEFGCCLLGQTADETVQSLRHPRRPHVMVVLKGIFKGQGGIERHHRFPLAPSSGSGVLQNEIWLLRLLEQYV